MDQLPSDLARLRRRWSRALIGSAAVLALVLLTLGLAWEGSMRARDTVAPPFDLPLLDGGRVTDEDLRGHAVVINVWGSWCPPCRGEAPALRRVHQGLDPDEVVMLGVIRNDTEPAARAFIEEFGLGGFDHAMDDGSFARAYALRVVPTTYILDRQGRLVATHAGPITESRLVTLIREATREVNGEAVP